MTDCEHPKCHEHFTTELADKVSWSKFNTLRDCVAKKIPKKWLWIGFCGLLVAIPAWSEITNVGDKYATRIELNKCLNEIAECKGSMKHVLKAVDRIERGQKVNGKDIKEILRYMRNE